MSRLLTATDVRKIVCKRSFCVTKEHLSSIQLIMVSSNFADTILHRKPFVLRALTYRLRAVKKLRLRGTYVGLYSANTDYLKLSYLILILCYVISCDDMRCHIMSYHVMSCHVMSYHVISCHIMSYHVISCHIMSYHVISCHIMSYHVMSCHILSCPQNILVSEILFLIYFMSPNS